MSCDKWCWHFLVLSVMAVCSEPHFASAQTYSQRIPRPAPMRLDGLPQVAARSNPSAPDPEQGRGEEKQPRQAIDLASASGQELIAEAARNVFEVPSLHARLRMKVAAHGRQVIASGEYMQLGAGTEKLVRLDLKVPVGNKVGIVQEIRGKDYLWMNRDLPPDAPKLERVVLRQARININRAEEAGRITSLDGWMLLGGLSRLLSALEKNFEFERPRPATLGEVPVLLVRGRWKPASLARLTGGKPDAELPPQLPQEVELTLAAPGQALALFPYRIEYLRPSSAMGERSGEGRGMPMTTIEFYEISQTADLRPEQFEFAPEEREFDDVTMPYLRRLGLAQPK